MYIKTITALVALSISGAASAQTLNGASLNDIRFDQNGRTENSITVDTRTTSSIGTRQEGTTVPVDRTIAPVDSFDVPGSRGNNR